MKQLKLETKRLCTFRTAFLRLQAISCVFFLAALSVHAATYAVKAAGGGSYTTIQACATAAAAGDICMVYAGSYSGWSQSASGTAGNPIVFTVNPGDSVTVTGNVTLSSGVSYVNFGQISGGCAAKGTTRTSPFGSFVTGGCFNFQGTVSVGSNSTASHIIVSHNTGTKLLFGGGFPGGGENNVSNSTISYNSIDFGGSTADVQAFSVWGNNNLIEYNYVGNGSGDFDEPGGQYNVFRHNIFHDTTGASSEHIDFFQVVGGSTLALSNSLIEENYEVHCYNDSGNCHFVQARASGGQVVNGLIVRYNYAQNLDGGTFVAYGDHTDGTATALNGRVYNNTVALENEGTGVYAILFDASTGGAGFAYNNIIYNSHGGTQSPLYYTYSGSGNGNLAYDSDSPAASWGTPYSSEPTFSALHSKNPNFANYPADISLSAGSPALNAGVALTTVASGDSGSGTSLIVNDPYLFQPGWGPTNSSVSADCIAVGTTANHVCITAINYATHTLTLASSVTRSSGDSVWLYSDSSGEQVLSGNAPNIGASFDSSSGTSVHPDPPTGVSGSVVTR